MLQRLKMLSLFDPSVIEQLLGFTFKYDLTPRDRILGTLSHLSYNSTRVELERPVLVFFRNEYEL